MEDVNPYAAPLCNTPLNFLIDEPGGDVWRDGDLLVMRKGAVLPDRCVKCNAPADGGHAKLRVHWFAPARLLGASFPLIERTAKLEVGLCYRHHRGFQRCRAVAIWLLRFVLSAQ